MPSLPQAKTASGPTFSDPEGIIMLMIAVAADFIPPLFILLLDILLGLGEPFSWGLDIFFTATLGTWMYLRGSDRIRKGRNMRFLKRRGLWILGEYVPILGSIAPFWTINVVRFLRSNK